jgi:hypothetical protein
VLGLNWRANFFVSLLISVFSFHLFFSTLATILYRHHHFFSIPRAFSRTCHTGACDVPTLPRCAIRRTGSASVCSLRLTKKRSQATRQQPANKKKSKETKQRKTKDKKKRTKKRRTEGRSVQQFLLPTVSGSQRVFFLSSFVFIFPFSFFIRTCDQQRV